MVMEAFSVDPSGFEFRGAEQRVTELLSRLSETWNRLWKRKVNNPSTEHQAIIIPEGKMAGIGDYSLVSATLPPLEGLGNEPRRIEQIALTSPGNCAEYGMLNMAIILKTYGGSVNPDVDRWLETISPRSLNNLEADLIIPIIDQERRRALANGSIVGRGSAETSLRNMIEKTHNPNAALDNINALFLFLGIFASNDIPDGSTFATVENIPKVRNILEKMKNSETFAMMLGGGDGGGHMVGILKLGDNYLTVDAMEYAQKGLIVRRTPQNTDDWVINRMVGNGAFVMGVEPRWK